MIINIINLGTHQPVMPSMNPNLSDGVFIRNREERVLSICAQSKQHGFSVRFWEGIIEKQAMSGINKSFKKIVRWAKEQGLKMVCIGEDDLVFSAPGAWQYYLDNMPNEFDIYSGGIYSGQIKEGRIVNGYSGNTLITVHEKFYDFFLSANEKPEGIGCGHLDRWLGNFAFERNYRICEPFVVRQMEGYSENHRRETRHTSYLEKMKLFGC